MTKQIKKYKEHKLNKDCVLLSTKSDKELQGDIEACKRIIKKGRSDNDKKLMDFMIEKGKLEIICV